MKTFFTLEGGWDTSLHCLPKGTPFDSGTFDCSKGRCQPSEGGTSYLQSHAHKTGWGYNASDMD